MSAGASASSHDNSASPGGSASKLISWISQKISNRIEGIGFTQTQNQQDSNSGIDESLSIDEKIEVYASDNGTSPQKVLVVKNCFVEAATQRGAERTEQELIGKVESLAHDANATVRQAVVEVIPALCRVFVGCEEELFTRNVLHVMLPLVAELTTDENGQTRTAASQSLVDMAKNIISHEHLLPYVLPIIRSLSKDKTEEEHRVQAAVLFHSLATSFGAEVVKAHVVSCMVVLAADPQFRVRKVVASKLGSFADVIKQDDSLDALLAAFLTLANDDIWGVRKACCESMVSLSTYCKPHVRTSQLVPVFERMIEDSSRWVRAAAYGILGRFIATFGATPAGNSNAERVDPKLLVLYKTMPHPSQQGRDGDLSLDCAFSFPGVLLTLGGDRWDELKSLHLHLAKDLQWQVRRTLSHSLHEVAAIIGTERTEESLLPLFDAFMDDLEEVKVGVVTNLAAFFRVLSPKSRSRYSQLISKLQADTINWRFRELLARQLVPLAALYAGTESMEMALVPSAVKLCMDKVISVRNGAVQGLAHILVNSVTDEVHREGLLGTICSWKDNNFHDRKTLALLIGYCHALGGGSEISMLADLLFSELVQDPTPNVRIIVAKVILENQEVLGQERAAAALQKLKLDVDYDVRFAAGDDWTPFPERTKRPNKKP